MNESTNKWVSGRPKERMNNQSNNNNTKAQMNESMKKRMNG